MSAVPTIGIIDYSMGNIRSLTARLSTIGASCRLISSGTSSKRGLDAIILPGVGNFSRAMRNITERGLKGFVDEFCNSGRPILGICLGFQLMFESSLEGGTTAGLGLVEGQVAPFGNSGEQFNYRTNVGFAPVSIPKSESVLFGGFEAEADFYFVHSYRVEKMPESFFPSYSSNGAAFVSSFEYKNTFGTQFHPEKSQGNGARVLQNFLNRI